MFSSEVRKHIDEVTEIISGHIGCTEPSVRNYHCSLCNLPKDRIPQGDTITVIIIKVYSISEQFSQKGKFQFPYKIVQTARPLAPNIFMQSLCPLAPHIFLQPVCPLAPYIFMHSVCPLAPNIFMQSLCPLAPHIFLQPVCPLAPYIFMQSVCPMAPNWSCFPDALGEGCV